MVIAAIIGVWIVAATAGIMYCRGRKKGMHNHKHTMSMIFFTPPTLAGTFESAAAIILNWAYVRMIDLDISRMPFYVTVKKLKFVFDLCMCWLLCTWYEQYNIYFCSHFPSRKKNLSMRYSLFCIIFLCVCF